MSTPPERAPSRRRRVLLLVVACVLPAVIASACSALPDSGEVHVASSRHDDVTGYSRSPAGPAPGATPLAISHGFLSAMQAVPPSTAIAREFLTSPERKRWNPASGTLIYDSVSYRVSGSTVRLRLANARRLDSRGGWVQGAAGRAAEVDLTMRRENGQWRIAGLPDELMVPVTFFTATYSPHNLYFFDRTGTMLVPDQVYLPRQGPTASSLVRALLAGPGRRLRGLVRSAIPAHTSMDIGVGVNDAGVAEVPLSEDVLGLDPARLRRVFLQLAWTLGQVPGIQRVRVTVDRAPVLLPDDEADISVDAGREYDPETLGAAVPLAVVRSGRVLTESGDATAPAAGPFGRGEVSLRSIGQDVKGDWLAGVSSNGTTVYTAPESASGHLTRVLTGTDVLRPDYDPFGWLWLVDRTAHGARISVVHDGVTRAVRVPGLSGQDVRAFAISQDGTHLVAALASTGGPVVRIADIVRSATGEPGRVGPATSLTVNVSGLGPVVDLGWRSPGEVVLLTQGGRGDVKATVVQADGSLGDGSPTTSEAIAVGAPALVVPPSHTQAVMLVDRASGHVYRLQQMSSWLRTSQTGVTAAAYG